MTLAVPRRTNVPRPTRKDAKDTPDRVFKNIDCSITFGTEGVLHNLELMYSGARSTKLSLCGVYG